MPNGIREKGPKDDVPHDGANTRLRHNRLSVSLRFETLFTKVRQGATMLATRSLRRSASIVAPIDHSQFSKDFVAPVGEARTAFATERGYFHAAGRRMKLPWVPTGIASGSWHLAGRSRGMSR